MSERKVISVEWFSDGSLISILKVIIQTCHRTKQLDLNIIHPHFIFPFQFKLRLSIPSFLGIMDTKYSAKLVLLIILHIDYFISYCSL